ncbi:iron-sulfur flavoprotein [Geobacter sp. OR-1]|uniref:flavodoxin family protein n=1 Tax=Geobacter sp. OR-1 TaxID=1266765 RepID=UPI0005441DED|nr:flavodoxin family protein [Geobacter sp. OR-1]GAM10494.1 iron-sulfur flavoprotein [Geobacter sp. OR-1]
MKIACLLGSPRKGSCSSAIAGQLVHAAVGLGATAETFTLNDLSYRGCQGCYACKKSLDHCILNDDLTGVLEAVQEADILVMASPVYYGDITAQMKGFFDRTFSYLKPDYLTNASPSRLAPGKKMVMIQTQGHPDEKSFADIFSRYRMFLDWTGYTDCRLIRACGLSPDSSPETLAPYLDQAKLLANELLNP